MPPVVGSDKPANERPSGDSLPYSSSYGGVSSRSRSSARGPGRATPTPEQQKRRRTQLALLIVVLIVGVAFGAGWNPPTKTVHKFSRASDYKEATESGCTNSGAGCHGSETSYANFNAYHPNAECLDCHDYQGVACIPCHMPRDVECQLCHDGSMKRAADVVRIGDPFPKGHYRETTHTAMGTVMTEPVVGQTGGKAQATCKDCHSRDLRKAHTEVPAVEGSAYGVSVGCYECHNDVRSFGQAEVLANWKGRKCESCHKLGSSTPMHANNVAETTKAESPLGCGESGAGCHEGNMLHDLHRDVPKNCSGSAVEGEPGCHELGKESLNPTVSTCGGPAAESCHPAGADGTYTHKKVDATHSPSTNAAASDTNYFAEQCGGCHSMAPNGKSLISEHGLATSARSESDDPCLNCHNNPASTIAVAEAWPEKSRARACEACHGRDGLDPVHDGAVDTIHTFSGSTGCASSGPGCHPTSDISEVGIPSTQSNIHNDCLRCHDRTASNGNLAYDPSKRTCGADRDCHSQAGDYEPSTSVHNGSAGLTDGDDAHHNAGSGQGSAVYRDFASGTSTSCKSCHDMRLGTEHKRPRDSSPDEITCRGCHNKSEQIAGVVKDQWPTKSTTWACGVCHPASGALDVHGDLTSAHVGAELGVDGLPSVGACSQTGCHGTTDLRKLHRETGCTATGCHTAVGDPLGRDVKSCGGGNTLTACHVGCSADNHFADHRADIEGTRLGITYVTAANVGCFGCHDPDLQAEHSREFAAGSLDGSAGGPCAVCHADPNDPGSGTFAGTPAVRNAIKNHDRRCTACHDSGSGSDTAQAVASPHRQVSGDSPLPAGKVWSDPLADWKAAFDAVTGSGHNGPSATLVGGSRDKAFPQTSFTIDGKPYLWSLPPNNGSTTWLKASELGTAAVETTDSISHITITCDDCHAMPADMSGPHGASVHVGIDPAYSQTEYADPTARTYQFRATGTDRVVCMKCHNMEATNSTSPGGNPVHGKHVAHDGLPSGNPQHYGAKCIDCHVRIPHAWKRPRLLIRTAVTTDGVAPDAFPYIATGHDGLAGIVLRDFHVPTDLRSRYCVTSGCHAKTTSPGHPLPSDMPTTALWP